MPYEPLAGFDPPPVDDGPLIALICGMVTATVVVIIFFL